MTNEDLKQTPPKPKARRGMPVIDPKKGLVVSADAAQALIAQGAADARPKQGPVGLETSISRPVATAAPSIGTVSVSPATSYPRAQTQPTSLSMVCQPVP